ncbi:MAG: hypothetical protein HQ495_04420 [Alphaproteobacteria bacterium]|nr:hypothetical protein [Alphaproteobacteria bacterium]
MDHKIAYPDIDGRNPNNAPDWLRGIETTDDVVTLTAAQVEIACRNMGPSHVPTSTAQRKFDSGGLVVVREWLFQKSKAPPLNLIERLAATDGALLQSVEDLFAAIAAAPGNPMAWLKANRPQVIASIDGRRALRGDDPL